MPRGVSPLDEARLQGRLWSPALLRPGLALWLDAADSSTITLNGSNVAQWNDKSGNGRHVSQATAANQPAYVASALNGKAGVNFYQNKGLLNASASTVAQFVCVVTKSQNAAWAGFHAHLSGTSGTGNRIGGIRFGGNTGFFSGPFPSAVWEDGVAKTAPLSGGFNTINSPHIIGYTAASSTGNPMPGISIGNYDGGVVGGAGFEFETIVLSTVPTTATRERVEGYLAWQWGLDANLPANHPFRNRPPLIGG
jgi:hypothetical protein